jgi:lipoate-protein ligase A
MPFTIVAPPEALPQHARFDEQLIELASEIGPHACIWEGGQGLVVPRTYRRHQGFEQACRDFAQDGWPVTVRLSGGGVVPQGPGIINLSLAYAVDGKPLDHSDGAYQRLCAPIQDALGRYGVITAIRAVEGSFCDGRYNLAVEVDGTPRKVAGAAQVWRRAGDRQIVLAHALILSHVDVDDVTRRANRLEDAIGSARRYDADRAVSLHQCLPPSQSATSFRREFKNSLEQALKRMP